MMKPPIQKRPAYPIESVDHTLRIAQRLRDEGTVRLTDLANDIGVAPSTVHRLMAMLVYRGFAIQDENRRYGPGPALSAPVVQVPRTRALRTALEPSLDLLRADLNATVNLIIRVGASVRFLSSFEARSVLRISERTGAVHPAHISSGGKALLAEEPDGRIERLFRGRSAELAGHSLSDSEYAQLLSKLRLVRLQGYAVNREESEPGVGAIGLAVRGADHRAVAAISVAMPMHRLQDHLESERKMELMQRARDEMSETLAEAGVVYGA